MAELKPGAGWRLEVLGGATLVGPSGPLRLERKTAAVLGWLAREGATPKYRFSGLLWPESTEVTARNNMRQLLRRLRVATGCELLHGGDSLSLADAVVTDVGELVAHVAAGRHEEALAPHGALLGGLDFDDCPDFEAWLRHAREAVEALRRRAASAGSEHREQHGDMAGALAFAERLLELDPHSEEAHRRLMRLHYLHNDRAAALGLYERCRKVLREEYATEPSEETRALARELQHGQPGARRPATSPPRLPLTVLRPPVLVGREREWRRMEEAYAAGHAIFLLGEAGVGKTRLAMDFAASKGAYALFPARPGDPEVEYSTHVRTIRRFLAQRPEVKAGLEPWLRRELARVLPEYAESDGLPAPMASEADRMRFLDAHAEVIRRCFMGLAAVIVDDFQYTDAATLEIGRHERAQGTGHGAEGSGHGFIDCVRPGELSPEMAAWIRGLEAVGLATLIELEPLPPESVGALLESLAIPGATRWAREVARYTGGNPLFITETVKHLMESGGLEAWPERLPPPGRVKPLIQQRLERLSSGAMQLAQVAALANTHFALEVAGEVLERSPLSFQPELVELESAQIFKGEGFTHDLVFEAVRAAIPAAMRALLHRRLAAALEKRRVPPEVVARHWLEGGEPKRAVPFLMAAAQAGQANLRLDSATQLQARAAALLEDAATASS